VSPPPDDDYNRVIPNELQEKLTQKRASVTLHQPNTITTRPFQELTKKEQYAQRVALNALYRQQVGISTKKSPKKPKTKRGLFNDQYENWRSTKS
jgi:hypothetical protein